MQKIVVWEHVNGVLLLIVNILCLHAVGCVAVVALPWLLLLCVLFLFGSYVCSLTTFVVHKSKTSCLGRMYAMCFC